MIICSQCGFENRKKVENCQNCGRRLSQKGHFRMDDAMKKLSLEARERYEIKELLGRGGMAAVYKAYDKRLKRYVALKILSQELVANRFEREAILAARLEHPNIVIIHDIGKEKSEEYISMSYIEGDTLEVILTRSKGPLPRKRAVEIIKEVVFALSFAHEQGVIHRDIKPSNIMINRRGRAIVTDFGIARATTDIDMTKLTMTGTVVGTPRYMSPEQIEGKETDRRTDIYAVGIVLYEMLAGKSPFEGDTALALGIKKMMEKPKPLRELNPSIPEKLERIVLKAIKKKPEERYQDTESFFKELEECEEIEKVKKKKEEEKRRKTEELRQEEDKKETEMSRLLEEDERRWEEAEKRKKAEELLLEEKRKAEEERKKKEGREEKRGIEILIQERQEKREREKCRQVRSWRRRRFWKGLILIVLLGALAYILFKVVHREPGEEPLTLPPAEEPATSLPGEAADSPPLGE